MLCLNFTEVYVHFSVLHFTLAMFHLLHCMSDSFDDIASPSCAVFDVSDQFRCHVAVSEKFFYNFLILYPGENLLLQMLVSVLSA